MKPLQINAEELKQFIEKESMLYAKDSSCEKELRISLNGTIYVLHNKKIVYATSFVDNAVKEFNNIVSKNI